MALAKAQVRRRIRVLATILLLWAVPGVARAQDQAPPPINSSELAAFFSGMIATQRDAFHLPGATVSVVQDGKLIFSNGYGYANVAKRTPVVADATLFRAASVSKLFVWTAVMQLVEQGKLDLNADVNTYLTSFKIPRTYSRPITLADLMTHSAGFEDRALGMSVRSTERLEPLGEFLASNIPARVRPPGQLTAYSNYGAALAGYIVGQVSGMPFDQYVEQHIFQPLGMRHSTFRQPLPAGLAPNLAIGYRYVDGAYQPLEPIWDQLAPAGALSATADDLANFMIAQLQGGQFGDAHILQPATAKEMQQQSFTNDPRVNGIAHGFMEATLNGQHLLFHTGDEFAFHSGLVLLPEHNLGFFVDYNGSSGMLAVLNTIRAFMDQYFPASHPVPITPANLTDAMTRYAGAYRPARSEYTTLGKLAALFQSITVAPMGSDQLVVSLGYPAQITWRYVESDPLVFQSTDVPPAVFGNVVFRADSHGRIQYLFQENNPTTAYVKSPWYATPGFTTTLLGILVTLFLSVLVWAPVGFWIRLHYGERRPFLTWLPSWWSVVLSVVSLVFLAGSAALFSNPETVLGLPAWAPYLFALPWGIVIMAIGMAAFTVLAWMHRYWSVPGRIHFTLVTLATVAFI